MFKSVSLQNFKCFGSTMKPIEFKQINIVTGSNGRGKSSLFQSLLLLAQSYEAGKDWLTMKIKGKFVDLGNYRDIVRKGDINEKIYITIETDNEKDNIMKFVAYNSDGHGVNCAFENIYVNDTPLIDIITVGDKSSEEALIKTGISTSTYECFSQFGNIFYIAADRRGQVGAESMEEVPVGNNIGAHGEKIINSLFERKDAFQHQVADELSFILGGASVKAKNTEDFEAVRLYLDSIDGSEGFKPVNVGFGYSYILPIVVFPLIVPEGSKLYIENPEAHLHPGAQSRLMEFLVRIAKERKLQLFIESHSDHIINATRISVKKGICGVSKNDTRILHVGRDESNVPIVWQIKIDREGNLSDYPQEFMDEWTKQMLELV